MHETHPANQAVSSVDRGETAAAMMPLTIGQTAPERAALSDQVVALVARSSGFQHSLPPGIASALAELVRAMNCYYSNLIEGHATHPIDIERALREDFSAVAEQRDLQLEARAHIAVQAWIDGGGLQGVWFRQSCVPVAKASVTMNAAVAFGRSIERMTPQAMSAGHGASFPVQRRAWKPHRPTNATAGASSTPPRSNKCATSCAHIPGPAASN